MNPTTLAIIAGLTRQLLSILGTMSAFKGLSDQSTVEAIVGAVMILVSGIWNIHHKVKTTTNEPPKPTQTTSGPQGGAGQ